MYYIAEIEFGKSLPNKTTPANKPPYYGINDDPTINSKQMPVNKYRLFSIQWWKTYHHANKNHISNLVPYQLSATQYHQCVKYWYHYYQIMAPYSKKYWRAKHILQQEFLLP